MTVGSFDERRRLAHLDRAALAELQLEKLNRLLAVVLAENELLQAQAGRLSGAAGQPRRTCRSSRRPRRTNCSRQSATNRSPPIARTRRDRYVRCHQTSGTRGRPLVVLDTADDWQWWIDCWQYVLDAASVTPSDRAMLAFSFGPFIGFWSAFDALVARGALVIPGGGLGSLARIELIRNARVTTLLVHADLRTPTGRSGGRAQHQPGPTCGRENHRRRRTGRQRARHARTDRIGLGSAASSITAARPKSVRGDSPMPQAAACTSTKRNSSPSSFLSKRASRPRKASCRT